MYEFVDLFSTASVGVGVAVGAGRDKTCWDKLPKSQT